MASPSVFARERGLRADIVMRRILSELMIAIRYHGDAVLLDHDIEALHDFRVAVRRSRVAAALLAKTTSKKEISVFQKDLKWFGEVTGECRDLDVLLEEFGDGSEVLSRVRLMLVEDRFAAHQQVLHALRSRRFERSLDDWEDYLRSAEERPNAPLVEDLAAVRINKARAHVALACAQDLDAAGLHRIRIAYKRLRYDLEFFREIENPERSVESISRMKRLQDVLGAHHDAYLQRLRYSEMKCRSGVDDSFKSALEELCRSLVLREEELRVESLEALARMN